MKRTALILATAAMALTSTIASAQSYGGRGGYDGRSSVYSDRNHGYRAAPQWRTGQRLASQYRGRDRYVSDYSRYRLRAPPRGYGYYRQDNGDILMAALATGLIASIISGGDVGYSAGYGVPAYGYAAPAYGYGAGQVFYDSYGRPYTMDAYGNTVWVR